MKNIKSRLEKAIDFILKNRKIHISIHNVAGINCISELTLPQKYIIHECEFCNTAKITSRGHNICIKCKALSVLKCSREKKPYTGRCFLGIRHMIYPVIYKGEIICIIYVGNMILKHELEKTKKRIRRMEKYTGVASELLEQKLETLEIADNDEECMQAAEMARDVILSVLSECEPRTFKSKNHIVDAVTRYCERYYDSDLKLSLLAQTYFIHPDYLCRLFKRETGVSFCEYLNNIRIHKAKQLLKSTEKKIIDIAYEVGYKSDTYFIRRFKQAEGITPKQYKIHLRK